MFIATSSLSAQWIASRADSHAPIGVMGDHRHEAGEVMLSYRFMWMSMEGSRDGTTSIDDGSIVDPDGYGFMVTPERMPMRMHMFGAMFAPSDRIALMGMLPILSSEMDHITRAGGACTTESDGVGDVKVGAMIGLADFDRQTVHLNAMVSLPTGSIEEQDVLPTSNGNEVQLPYPMQVGSGTVDLLPAITWLGQSGDWSWGAQGGATLRLGENDREWKLGNRGTLTAWGARNLSRNVSASLRLVGATWGDVVFRTRRLPGVARIMRDVRALRRYFSRSLAYRFQNYRTGAKPLDESPHSDLCMSCPPRTWCIA